MPDQRLRVQLPRNITLKDPLLLASGCCGYGLEYAELAPPASFGGIITKAVSLEPRAGNPPVRLHETPAGLMNCIGLQNPGAEEFCNNQLQQLIWAECNFLVNVVGHSVGEFAGVVAAVEASLSDLPVGTGIAPGGPGLRGGFLGYELDLSCPNVESGTQFATDLQLLRDTVSACRRGTSALLVAKLSPNVTDIVPYAAAAAECGADAVTIANTWAAVCINPRTRRSYLARPSAGLSGPAIRAATLYHVWRCHRALPNLPIFGSGGITDADSALQFLLAGASVLELGTGLFLNPRLPLELRQGITHYLNEQGAAQIGDIVGTFDDTPVQG
jgi:dihydroorotate dehydrogenase (NAD+) catalytic subunit